MAARSASANTLLPGLQRAEATDIIQLMKSTWWYGAGGMQRPGGSSLDEHADLPPRRPPQPRPVGSSSPEPRRPQVQRLSPFYAEAEPHGEHAYGSGAEHPSQAIPPTEREGQGGMQLGTWAERKRLFTEHLRQEEEAEAAQQRGQQCGPAPAGGSQQLPQAQAQAQDGRASLPPQRIPSTQRPPPARQQSNASTESDSELHAAWRWRFSRKWQMEQAKQFDPEYGRGGPEDEEPFEAALGFMDAVEGLNLQIARTVSVGTHSDQNLSMVERSGLSLLSPSLSLSQGMLLEGSVAEGGAGMLRDDHRGEEGGHASATRHIQRMARNAQHLLKHKQEIERRVDERWSTAGGGPAGASDAPPGAAGGGAASGLLALVPAVQLDSWGSFTFVLVRLTDRHLRQKLVLRGRNGCSEGAVLRLLEQEVGGAAAAQRTPAPRLELLGSGAMEWSRDRDRCLLVSGGRLHSSGDARLRSQADVAALAGALSRASLPTSFTVEQVHGRNGTLL